MSAEALPPPPPPVRHKSKRSARRLSTSMPQVHLKGRGYREDPAGTSRRSRQAIMESSRKNLHSGSLGNAISQAPAALAARDRNRTCSPREQQLAATLSGPDEAPRISDAGNEATGLAAAAGGER